MTTALSLYSSNVVSTTLGTAKTYLPNSGATGTNRADNLLGTATGWDEIKTSNDATAWAALGAQGSPSGNGLLYDSTVLEGQTIGAGNWRQFMRCRVDTGSITATLVVRWYVYNAGVYTLIGSATLTGVTINTTWTTHDFLDSAQSAVVFGAGDKLYVDFWANVTANTTGSGTANFPIGDLSLTAGVGATGNQLNTPGYDPTQLSVTGVTGTPIAQYIIRVRDASYNLVGELTGVERALFTRRHNAVGAWAIQLDADNPLAPFLAADGYGIQVLRIIRDSITGARLSGDVFLSGPRWGRVRQMKDNTLIASGFDDNIWLQGRLAYQVTNLPYRAMVMGETGCLRYYTCGELTGNAIDLKSGVNGTYSGTGGITRGVTPIMDDGSFAATFDGVNGDGITLPTTSLPTGNAAWSLEAWATCHGFGTSNRTIIRFGQSGTKTAVGLKVDSTGHLMVDCLGTNAINSSVVDLDGIHHIVGTWDGTNLRLWIDGVNAATSTPGALAITLSSAHIGSWGSSERWNGTIMAAAMYSTTLTGTQIANHYALGPNRFKNAAYDTRSGAGETVIRQYVDVNAISAVNDQLGLSRVVPGLSLDPDMAQGGQVKGTARMTPLLDPDGNGLLQELGQAGGLGFDVTQQANALKLLFYVPIDRTANVKFSEELGNLSDFSYGEDGPDYSKGGDVVIVGGGSQDINRVFLTRADRTAITRWGRFENFQDARDSTDVATLQQRGDSALSQSAATTSAAITLAPQVGLVYGIDFGLGDKITVVVDGVSYTDIVREVQVTLDMQGAETVVPAVGTPSADTIRRLYGTYVDRSQMSLLRTTVSRLARAF